MPSHIVVLRHGHTTWASGGRWTSFTDVDLDTDGEAAAAAWAPTFSGVDLVAFCSPLLRTRRTAALAGLSAEIREDLVEWNLGELEGLNSERYRLEHPHWELFAAGAPGGESPTAVETRVGRLLDGLGSDHSDVVVLVTHGQIAKVIAAHLLQVPLRTGEHFGLGPARAAVFSWRGSLGGYQLSGWNRTPTPLDQLLNGNH